MSQPAVDRDLITRSRRAWGGLETLHVIGYFAPETTQAYVALGLHPRLSYFAARSAAMGPVGPELTVATFYVFSPELIRKALPAAWEIATPEHIQAARRAGVLAALRPAIGDAVEPAEIAEAAELARQATEGLTGVATTEAGRPLYAAHARLDWPEDPLLALWHAATLIREHRGDGHVAVLTGARLDPVEALVLGGLFADNTEFVRRTRGWHEEQWEAAIERLTGRGLLEGAAAPADRGLSEEGRALRQRVEDQTDTLATAAFDHLGAERTDRLIELVAPMRKAVLASGVLPGWISGRG